MLQRLILFEDLYLICQENSAVQFFTEVEGRSGICMERGTSEGIGWNQTLSSKASGIGSSPKVQAV